MRDAKKREPDLDPVSPLKAASERQNAPIREMRKELGWKIYSKNMGGVAEKLVHLLAQANLGTPVPPPPPPPPVIPFVPQYVPERQTLYPRVATKNVRDWRSLPVPDLWTRRPIVEKAPLKIHGYGSPVRRGYRG